MKILISRYSFEPKQTIGDLYVLNDKDEVVKRFDCLELPWKNNQRRISSIPEGKYDAKKHFSPRFERSIWLQNVNNRSEILIHKGNFFDDILGCILPGLELKDIDNDRLIDVAFSRQAMGEIYNLMPNEFEVEITSV